MRRFALSDNVRNNCSSRNTRTDASKALVQGSENRLRIDSHRPTRPEKGFTLIELMIVMVIIGSILALAAPRIGKSLEKMKLRSASRKLSAVLRYTRQMAISRKKEYAVTFDDHSYTYVIVVRKAANAERDEGQTSGSSSSKATRKAWDTGIGAGEKGLGETGIQEQKVHVDLRQELKTEEVSISCQKLEGENVRDNYAHMPTRMPTRPDEHPSQEPDQESEIIFYPKGESSGGKVILAMKEPTNSAAGARQGANLFSSDSRSLGRGPSTPIYRQGSYILAFQIEVDPITGRVVVKRKTEHE